MKKFLPLLLVFMFGCATTPRKPKVEIRPNTSDLMKVSYYLGCLTIMVNQKQSRSQAEMRVMLSYCAELAREFEPERTNMHQRVEQPKTE